jgi:hypothetical protein
MSTKKSDTSVSGKSFVRGKTIDDDEKRLGRPQAARVVRRVQSEKQKSIRTGGGTKGKHHYSRLPLKPPPKGPSNKAAARRVTIKSSYAKNRKQGQWDAHGRYLEREGAQKEGEKGTGFDASRDDVSLPSLLHSWQMAGDPRLFKVVISPEDGDRLALRDYTREYMARLAPHLSENPESVEWTAIEHYNTSHPHVHVLIRGNNNLQIPRELLAHGMRNLASEVATERLGYRTQREIERGKDREIDMRKPTQIDRDIAAQAKDLPDGRSLVMETLVPATDKGFAAQRRRIARLEALERMGLSEKIGVASWALDAGWQTALRDLQTLQTRTEMLAKSRALMTDPRCPPQVTKLKPGERLVGRVLGTGLDEQRDRSYIIIEGTDYRAHIVYQDAAIEKARAEQELQLRHLVAIEGRASKAGRPYTVVEDYGLAIPDKPKPVSIPQKALDDALDAGAKPSEQAQTGFQRYWHEQLIERMRAREKEREKEKAKQKAREQERPAPVQKQERPGKNKGIGI